MTTWLTPRERMSRKSLCKSRDSGVVTGAGQVSDKAR